MSTVRLDDQLYREVERWAAESRRTVEAVVAEAVQAALPRRTPEQRPADKRVVLPTFGGSGLQPGVNLDNSAALLDIMESPE